MIAASAHLPITMIAVSHILSTGLLPSAIFDDLYRRMVECAPDDIRLDLSIRPHRRAQVHHYHRPHREARLRSPAVVTVHHDPRDAHHWMRLPTFLPRWREAVKVICLNRTQEAMLRDAGIHHTVVIPHGIDRAVLPVPATPKTWAGGRIRLGLVSKRYDRGVKGESRLARLFAGLDPTRFEFVFAGQGRWRDAEEARRAGFAAISHEALPYGLFGQLYAAMDVLLILSDCEGGPACLPEALGSGTPVAATPVGMVPDWVEHNENGIILDDSTLVDQVSALADPGVLERLNRGVFATADRIPAWQEVMGRQFALYREIAGGAR